MLACTGTLQLIALDTCWMQTCSFVPAFVLLVGSCCHTHGQWEAGGRSAVFSAGGCRLPAVSCLCTVEAQLLAVAALVAAPPLLVSRRRTMSSQLPVPGVEQLHARSEAAGCRPHGTALRWLHLCRHHFASACFSLAKAPCPALDNTRSTGVGTQPFVLLAPEGRQRHVQRLG